jgi:hypothetical protein
MRWIIPRTGMIVLDPVTHKALPAEGAEVEVDSYWIRRLNDGDVFEPPVRPKRPRENKGSESTEG